MKTIKKAIKILGSKAELARKLGVRADRPYTWENDIYFPSMQTAMKIEDVTEGKVKAIDILHEKMQIKLKAMQKKVK